jgi:hypothetical protein
MLFFFCLYLYERNLKGILNMKNTLSENMMRFGTKNLSESAQKALIVKSIMQTINEHGLNNVIRKKLTEQAPDPKYLGYAQKIAGQLMKALGPINDDETAALNALRSIKTFGGKPVYDNLLQIVKTSPKIKAQFGSNFDLVIDMIASGGISGTARDSDGYTLNNPLAKLGMGLSDEEYFPKMKAILAVYNSDEAIRPD